MKSIFKFITFFVLFFSLIFKSFAIDSPVDLKVDNKTSTSVSLSWDNVQNALGYFVYYSTVSGLEYGYEEQSDILEISSYELPDLEPGNTYYISVVALDEDGEESIYSNEIVVDVIEGQVVESNVNDNFALEKINVLGYNKLELVFSNSLSNSEDAIREFKIINKNDVFDTFDVAFSEIDSMDDNKVLLILDRNTEIGSEYEVVIIAITNSNGDNIESGIDNSEVFMVTKIEEEVVEVEEEEEEEEEEFNLEELFLEELSGEELNSAESEQVGVSGTNLSNDEVENNTLSLSENNSKLPETGAEHVLIITLSIILGALIFKFKKS